MRVECLPPCCWSNHNKQLDTELYVFFVVSVADFGKEMEGKRVSEHRKSTTYSLVPSTAFLHFVFFFVFFVRLFLEL